MLRFLLMLALLIGAGLPFPVQSRAEFYPSATLLGPLGLNTAPSARMDPAGTARLSLSTTRHFTHGSSGFQFTDGLYISLRQTAEGPSLRESPDALHPGVDLKIRLRDEGAILPAVALGLNSALGSSRMAGEYLTFSKRYKSVDFSGGILHGRHKNKSGNNYPRNWISSGPLDFLGGAEYTTPIDGLSLKLDYAPQPFSENYDTSSRWGFALSYNPKPWINGMIGTQGGEALMARLSLQTGLNKWKRQNFNYWRDKRAQGEPQDIRYVDNRVAANFILSAAPESAPAALGPQSHLLEQEASGETDGIELTPFSLSLQGPRVALPRSDVHHIADKSGITSENLWKNIEFTTDTLSLRPPRSGFLHALSLTLENQISLAEPETGAIYRTAFIGHLQTNPFLGYLSAGAGLRLNLADNLDFAANPRGARDSPIRSDLDDFTRQRLVLDTLHLTDARRIAPDFYTLISSGYLEEQYFGTGAEALYRPFSGRLALGAEGWAVTKRDPMTTGHLGLSAQNDLSVLANAWYDLPQNDLVLSASVGQFLGGDRGSSLGAEKIFKNGVRLKGFVTVTNRRDKNASDEKLQNYHGISLHIPLGLASINTEISPLLRDAGQRVHAPLRLFDLTESFTLDHMARHWTDILPPAPDPEMTPEK